MQYGLRLTKYKQTILKRSKLLKDNMIYKISGIKQEDGPTSSSNW